MQMNVGILGCGILYRFKSEQNDSISQVLIILEYKFCRNKGERERGGGGEEKKREKLGEQWICVCSGKEKCSLPKEQFDSSRFFSRIHGRHAAERSV